MGSRAADEISQGHRLLSEEEQMTLITESMSITSADEEKLLLLNRNTELRRLNKEVRKTADTSTPPLNSLKYSIH